MKIEIETNDWGVNFSQAIQASPVNDSFKKAE